jgi:hypothetical protein
MLKVFRREPFKDRMWRDDKRRLHRKWGPAIENVNGSKRWYWNGQPVYEEFPNTSGIFGLPINDTICKFMTCNWEGGWTWGRAWRINGCWMDPDR